MVLFKLHFCRQKVTGNELQFQIFCQIIQNSEKVEEKKPILNNFLPMIVTWFKNIAPTSSPHNDILLALQGLWLPKICQLSIWCLYSRVYLLKSVLNSIGFLSRQHLVHACLKMSKSFFRIFSARLPHTCATVSPVCVSTQIFRFLNFWTFF